MTNQEIGELVQQSQRGDTQSFALLYQECKDSVYFYALKITRNQDAAEDVTQNTFVRAFRGINTLKNPIAFSSWISTICCHECSRFARDNDEFLSMDDESENIAETLEKSEQPFDPEEIADRKELQQILMHIIDTLPGKQKAAVILFYRNDLTVKQISEILNLSEGTVKSCLNYARKKIQVGILAYEQENHVHLQNIVGFPMFAWLLHHVGTTSMPLESAQRVEKRIAANIASFPTSTSSSVQTIPRNPQVPNVNRRLCHNSGSQKGEQNIMGNTIGTIVKSIKGKIVIAIIAAILVISGSVAYYNNNVKPNIDLSPYVSYQFSGPDTYGTIQLKTDPLNALTTSVIKDKNADEVYAFLSSLKYTADKTTNLKNGDTVTISASFDETKAKNAGIRAKNNSVIKTITVSGLSKLIAIDNIWDYIKVNQSKAQGTDTPALEIDTQAFDKKYPDFAGRLHVDVSDKKTKLQVRDYYEGEKVELTIDDENYSDKKNCILSSTSNQQNSTKSSRQLPSYIKIDGSKAKEITFSGYTTDLPNDFTFSSDDIKALDEELKPNDALTLGVSLTGTNDNEPKVESCQKIASYFASSSPNDIMGPALFGNNRYYVIYKVTLSAFDYSTNSRKNYSGYVPIFCEHLKETKGKIKKDDSSDSNYAGDIHPGETIQDAKDSITNDAKQYLKNGEKATIAQIS